MCEVARGDWLFRPGKKCLDGLMRHEVDLLIGGPRLYGQGHQLLIPPRRAFEDRALEREQGQAEGRHGSVESCGLHLIGQNSNTRAKFLSQREKERRRPAISA